MTWYIGTLFLCVLQLSASDWVSEWMTPLQGQLFEETPDSYRRSGSGGILKQYEDEYERMLPVLNSKEVPLDTRYTYKSKPLSAGGLKLKLETTLENARTLAEALAREIAEVTAREQVLKDTIARGRNGVTTVTVSTIGQLPRKYIIREGVWTLCTGVVQAPVAETNVYNELVSPAQCFGQEVTTKPDPCVFHSVIKYETIPTRRRLQYVEDDFLCLKPSFNTTMEYYMSVPRRLINETCTNGMIRSLEDNLGECGVRVLSEYNYYPNRGYSNPDLALDYCVESDGACKLIVAWHVSNATIENFEFLKNEPNFKKYFMKINSFPLYS